MDGFSQDELNNFRDLLIKLRDELQQVAEPAGDAAETVELDQSRVGRLSRMDAMQMQAMSQETNRRREEELKRIAIALRQIEEGEYGYCQECGEAIARGRLQADPAAMLCIVCASSAESV